MLTPRLQHRQSRVQARGRQAASGSPAQHPVRQNGKTSTRRCHPHPRQHPAAPNTMALNVAVSFAVEGKSKVPTHKPDLLASLAINGREWPCWAVYVVVTGGKARRYPRHSASAIQQVGTAAVRAIRGCIAVRRRALAAVHEASSAEGSHATKTVPLVAGFFNHAPRSVEHRLPLLVPLPASPFFQIGRMTTPQNRSTNTWQDD